MKYQEIPENPKFDNKIQKINESTIAHADVMNGFLNTFIQNDVFLAEQINQLKALMIPVGYLFEWEPVSGSTINLSTPQQVNDYYGFGTWKLQKDRFLIGAGGIYTVSGTGGESAHTLSAAETPVHNHNYNGTTAASNPVHAHTGGTDAETQEHTHYVGIYGNGNHAHAVYTRAGTGGGSAQLHVGYAQDNTGYHASGEAGQHAHTTDVGGRSAAHNHRFTTDNQNVNHSHIFSGATTSTGGNAAHNNMPPYKAVYIWKRIA